MRNETAHHFQFFSLYYFFWLKFFSECFGDNFEMVAGKSGNVLKQLKFTTVPYNMAEHLNL